MTGHRLHLRTEKGMAIEGHIEVRYEDPIILPEVGSDTRHIIVGNGGDLRIDGSYKSTSKVTMDSLQRTRMELIDKESGISLAALQRTWESRS